MVASTHHHLLNTSFIVITLVSSHLLVSFGRHQPHILHFEAVYLHKSRMDSCIDVRQPELAVKPFVTALSEEGSVTLGEMRRCIGVIIPHRDKPLREKQNQGVNEGLVFPHEELGREVVVEIHVKYPCPPVDGVGKASEE